MPATPSIVMRHALSSWLLGVAARGALASLALTLIVAAREARATPLYSVTAGSRCDSCHIEPVSWLEPTELRERHRTVNCSACHIAPTGGGQRSVFGLYYGREVLPQIALEPRPGSFVDTDKYANANDLPVRDIQDRLGDIDPESRYGVGFDGRIMLYKALGADASVFPMQLDLHAFARPIGDWSIYGTLGLQGRRQRTIERPTEHTRTWRDLATIRELVVQRALPYNGYVRGGRFTKPYGWRTPDHTVSTRQPLDYDQYSQVFGIEGGVNPEFPFANLALFYQGVADFPGERLAPGMGASMTAGYRDFEWQIGVSAEYLRLLEARDQLTTGLMWGITFEPFAYLGQADARLFLPEQEEGVARGVYTYHELAVVAVTGVTLKGSLGWYRTRVWQRDTQRTRLTMGGQWDVVTHLQVASEYRINWKPGAPLGHEVLAWLHVWL